jgi:hypothetical protein
MKKQRLAQVNTAQAAIIFIVFSSLSSAALATITEPTEPYVSYTVQPKDTLQGLARTLLQQPSQWGQVAKLNGLKNPNLIYPGQVIDVPKSLLNLNSQPRIAITGKVLSVEGDVKLGGQAVQAGAAVPEGARLQTGPNSSAVVELGDGSRMQLMPKTLAEVTSQHGYALRDPSGSASTTWFSGAIRLVEGVLDTLAEKKAKRATPLEVTTPTSVVGVRGTQFRVAYEDPASGTARTEVIEGNVRNDITAQKVSANVGGGFGAAMKPTDREVKVVALLPALSADQLPSQVVRNTSSGAAWTVGSLKGAAGYRAQFATDEKFAQIRGDFKSASPAVDVTALANGSYYARVRGIDPAGIEGFDAIQLVQISAAPVAVTWPREIYLGASASYKPDGLLLKIYDRSSVKPEQLTVQVARDAAFTQGLQSTPVASNATALLPNVPAGQRSYVRFTSSAPGQQSVSATFVMDVPANWGSTVLGLTQALQPLR